MLKINSLPAGSDTTKPCVFAEERPGGVLPVRSSAVQQNLGNGRWPTRPGPTRKPLPWGNYRIFFVFKSRRTTATNDPPRKVGNGPFALDLIAAAVKKASFFFQNTRVGGVSPWLNPDPPSPPKTLDTCETRISPPQNRGSHSNAIALPKQKSRGRAPLAKL